MKLLYTIIGLQSRPIIPCRSIIVRAQTWHVVRVYAYCYTVLCELPADHVAIPDFSAGAMENWGLILYRESSILHDDVVSSMSNKLWVSLVIAHEIAHTVLQYAVN